MENQECEEEYVYRLYDPIFDDFRHSRSGRNMWATKGAMNSAKRWMMGNERLIIKKYKLVEVIEE
jgi:hypothetical protein